MMIRMRIDDTHRCRASLPHSALIAAVGNRWLTLSFTTIFQVSKEKEFASFFLRRGSGLAHLGFLRNTVAVFLDGTRRRLFSLPVHSPPDSEFGSRDVFVEAEGGPDVTGHRRHRGASVCVLG